MAITKLERDLNIVSSLDNEPNDVSGMTADDLKAKFDEGSKVIQEYINETLIPETEQEISEVYDHVDEVRSNLQEDIDSRASKEEVHSIVLGQIPDNSISAEKLTPELRARNYTKDETDAAIEAADKIGDIKTTLRNDLGDKWLPCDGRVIDKAQYPELYSMYKFGINAQFFKDDAAGTTICAVHVDDDCVVVMTRGDAVNKMNANWKLHTEETWHSQEVFANSSSSSYGASNVRVSTANGKICVVFTAYATSSTNHYFYELHCDKTDFVWSAAKKLYSQECYNRRPAPVRFINGYYLTACCDKSGYPHLGYSSDLVTWNGIEAVIKSTSVGEMIDITYDSTYEYYYIYACSGTMQRVIPAKLGATGSVYNNVSEAVESNYVASAIYDNYIYFALDYTYTNNYKDRHGFDIARCPMNAIGGSSKVEVTKRIPTIVGAAVLDMQIEDGIAYVMTEDRLYKYNIETGEAEYRELNITPQFGAISVSAGKMLMGNTAYYETKPSTPKISLADTNAFIKAKM